MRKFKNLNVIRETDNEVIIEKLLEDGFEEVEEVEEEVEEVEEEPKGTNKGKGE